MKQIVAGLFAHVDAGKTTLAEALLYQSGFLRQLGRVDKGNAFLDSEQLEKKRGITIFSHLARLKTDSLNLTLLDTPGHVDFAAQTEAVLPVLDYAILLISANEGVTSYTQTLWRLLAKYHLPVFIFVNKMDENGADSASILKALQHDLSAHCFSFMKENENWQENIAAVSDEVLTAFLKSGQVSAQTVGNLIAERLVFPVYFGSALKLKGSARLLSGLAKWTKPRTIKKKLGVRVFKISHDKQGQRLTWLRVLGGNLPAKTTLLPAEKINQIRIYNGKKYKVVPKIKEGGSSCCYWFKIHLSWAGHWS